MIHLDEVRRNRSSTRCARPDFQVLMMDLEFPSDPFSKHIDSDR